MFLRPQKNSHVFTPPRRRSLKKFSSFSLMHRCQNPRHQPSVTLVNGKWNPQSPHNSSDQEFHKILPFILQHSLVTPTPVFTPPHNAVAFTCELPCSQDKSQQDLNTRTTMTCFSEMGIWMGTTSRAVVPPAPSPGAEDTSRHLLLPSRAHHPGNNLCSSAFQFR